MSNFSSTYPSVSPTYQIDFANGKRIPPNATFSRADSPIDATKAAASAVHFWSNEKHLSSENLLYYSNPNDAAWTEQGSSITLNQAASPDGTTTASLLTEDSSTGVHRGYRSIAGNSVSGQTYTFVGYLKANGRTLVSAQFNGSGITTARVEFDLSSSGTATSRAGSPANLSISQIGSTGWYKCSFQATATGAATMYLNVYLQDGADSTSYTGDGSSGAYAYGFNVSTTGQLIHEDTTTQIHREYAPTLKSVATAGAARFEYDPTDGQSMGCLLESSSTNLFTYSSDISNAAWTKTGTTATAEAIGPDGQLSAFALREDTGTSSHRLRQAATIGSGSVAFSVYAKLLGNTRRMVLREDSTTGAYATFDLSAGTVAASGAGGSGSIEAVGNGFYRCTMVSSPGADTKNFSAWLVTSSATNYENYTGDGYSGLLLAMPQIENQSFSSSWISTTSSTATRAADSLSVATSSFYTGGPVSVVGEVRFNEATSSANGGAAPRVFSLNDDGGDSEQLFIYRDTTTTKLYAASKTGGTTMAGVFASDATTTSNTDYKFAVNLNTNSFGAVVNGGSVSSDTSVAIPSGLNELAIGRNRSGANNAYMNGHFKRIAVYGDLSDTNLQALTS